MVYKCQEHNSYIVLKGLACADLAKKQTKNDFLQDLFFNCFRYLFWCIINFSFDPFIYDGQKINY